MTPLFGGGSLTFPAFLPRPKRAGRFKADNHSGMRDIKEGGFAAFLARIDVTPPPLSVSQTFSGSVTLKAAGFRPSLSRPHLDPCQGQNGNPG